MAHAPLRVRLRYGIATTFSVCSLAVLLSGCSSQPDLLTEARQLQDNLRFQESLEPLRQLIAERPENSEIYLLYGTALIRTGAPSLAVWPLRRAMEDPDLTVKAAILMAAAATQTGNVASAIRYATAALEIEPDNIEALALRSQARVHSRRDYEGSLADADRILELDPENPAPLIPRAVALLGLERIEEAAEALQLLEETQRDQILGLQKTAQFCIARSIFSRESGDPEKADEILADCLEEFPSTHTTVAEALKHSDAANDIEESVRVLKAALAEDSPWKRDFRVNLASRLRLLDRNDEAESLLRRAVEEAGNPALKSLSWSDLGNHYFEVEAFDPAAEAAGKAYELSRTPVPPDLLFDYAEALLLAERFDEAVDVAAEIELPAYQEFILARSHLMQGRPALAIEHFAAGHALWPNNAVARYYTARAAEQLGDFDHAIEEYRFSMRIEPRGTDARFRLARLYEAQGEYLKGAKAAGHGAMGDSTDDAAKLYQLRLVAKAGRIESVEMLLKDLLARPTPIPFLAVEAVVEGMRAAQNPEWVISMLDQMQELDLRLPENAAVLRGRVELLGDVGRTDDAVGETEISLRAEPNDPSFHAIHGMALEHHGVAAENVQAAYQRAIELDPKHPLGLLHLARRAGEAGDPQQGLALNERLLATNPQNVLALKQRARLLGMAGRSQESEESWEQILLADPSDAETSQRIAELRRRRGADAERTADLVRRAARFGPAAKARGSPATAGTGATSKSRPTPTDAAGPPAPSAEAPPTGDRG